MDGTFTTDEDDVVFIIEVKSFKYINQTVFLYIGKMKNNQECSYGNLFTGNNTIEIYNGTFKDDQKHGKGYLYSIDNNFLSVDDGILNIIIFIRVFSHVQVMQIYTTFLTDKKYQECFLTYYLNNCQLWIGGF